VKIGLSRLALAVAAKKGLAAQAFDVRRRIGTSTVAAFRHFRHAGHRRAAFALTILFIDI
jgi:hypothetical protein